MPGTPGAVQVGPGWLYVAPIGTTEPTHVSALLPSAWREVGYTESGNIFNANTTFEDVEVAEELDPILVLPTKRQGSVDFSMAEISATNLDLAFNGGTLATVGTSTTFEPPALGAELRLMLLWRDVQASLTTGTEMLLLRQVIQAGNIAMPRAKAPAKAVIPVSLRMEIPATGLKPFKFWVPSTFASTDPHV